MIWARFRLFLPTLRRWAGAPQGWTHLHMLTFRAVPTIFYPPPSLCCRHYPHKHSGGATSRVAWRIGWFVLDDASAFDCRPTNGGCLHKGWSGHHANVADSGQDEEATRPTPCGRGERQRQPPDQAVRKHCLCHCFVFCRWLDRLLTCTTVVLGSALHARQVYCEVHHEPCSGPRSVARGRLGAPPRSSFATLHDSNAFDGTASSHCVHSVRTSAGQWTSWSLHQLAVP